jgi:hypothetical protein
MTISFLYQFIWGLLISVAFVGWGRIVHKQLLSATSDDIDWGLAAGWGMTLVLIAGGLLSSVGAVSGIVLIGIVIVGALFSSGDIKRLGRLCNRRGTLLLLICIPLIVRYTSAVHFHAMSCADDDIAYFPMITKMLDTGTLIEPFSLRRLAGYGGHTFLQAMVGATGTEDNAYLMDRGIAVIVSFGLVIGYFAKQPSMQLIAGCIAVLLTVILPFPFLNSASHATGLVLFLTLFRTLARSSAFSFGGHAEIWLIGAVVAAAGSLRAHYLFVAAFTVTAFWFLNYSNRKETPSHYIASLFYVGIASTLCLLPWMVLLQLSSNTFMYPLFAGNHRPEFQNYSAPLSISQHFGFFVTTLLHARISMFLAPVILFAFRRKSRAALSLYIGSIAGTVAMAWVFTYSDVENIHRYVAPFLYAAFIGTLMVFVRDNMITGDATHADLKVRKYSNVALFGLVLIVSPLMMGKDINRIADHWDRRALSAELRSQYVTMQDALPKNAKVFAMVNHPFALNYKRNDIVNVDVPGAASPGFGMPIGQGVEKLKEYLKNLSITHVVFGDLNDRPACLYNRALWEFHRDGDIPAWKFGAPFYLNLMDDLETLAQTETVLFKKYGFHVIALN